ncbi:hypothetical protein KDW_58880 [Dictyobacter vulcani]|uniref:Uncharacterized protein n=1 Tax=Dictyobacter vulcani TaxID=2607529 RepID=A0A5J4L2N5_9CHLR|nr:DUF4878 domain-containing protein [Dictyobacter vulcani]GER91726.1 hypothetical protein KDW_58880 [Dictyobacter vulcani]
MSQIDQSGQPVETTNNVGQSIISSTTTRNTRRRLWFMAIMVVVLLVVVVGAIIFMTHGSSDDPQTIVGNYYTALKNKDYDTAIKYIQVTNAPNPSMNVTTAGELQTQEQAWQGTYAGPIQKYKINNQSINGQFASVNVTISRGTTYTMDVQLTQMNGKWMITGGGAPGYLY